MHVITLVGINKAKTKIKQRARIRYIHHRACKRKKDNVATAEELLFMEEGKNIPSVGGVRQKRNCVQVAREVAPFLFSPCYHSPLPPSY